MDSDAEDEDNRYQEEESYHNSPFDHPLFIPRTVDVYQGCLLLLSTAGSFTRVFVGNIPFTEIRRRPGGKPGPKSSAHFSEKGFLSVFTNIFSPHEWTSGFLTNDTFHLSSIG